MDCIKISDITMKQIAKSGEASLSFKGKLEIAKLLDRLGVSVIEVDAGIIQANRPLLRRFVAVELPQCNVGIEQEPSLVVRLVGENAIGCQVVNLLPGYAQQLGELRRCDSRCHVPPPCAVVWSNGMRPPLTRARTRDSFAVRESTGQLVKKNPRSET